MWCRNSTCNSKLLLHGALELLRRTTELFPPFKLGTATALRMRQVPGERHKAAFPSLPRLAPLLRVRLPLSPQDADPTPLRQIRLARR